MLLLRRIHLYLGCFFAPMIILFAITGVLQIYDIPWKYPHTILPTLSSIHTGHAGSKDPKAWNLSSDYLEAFAALAAVSLIVNMVLGIVIAFRLKHGRGAVIALVLGVVVPLILIVLFAHQGRGE